MGWIVDELDQPVSRQLVGHPLDALARNRLKLPDLGGPVELFRGDPLLRAYDTLILDEAHERSLNIDFLLGYMKRLIPRRPDLRIIVSSDSDNFLDLQDHATLAEARVSQ